MDVYLDRDNLPDTLVNITQATLNLNFTPASNGRQQTLTFDISFPNSSNLKKQGKLRVVARNT